MIATTVFDKNPDAVRKKVPDGFPELITVSCRWDEAPRRRSRRGWWLHNIREPLKTRGKLDSVIALLAKNAVEVVVDSREA